MKLIFAVLVLAAVAGFISAEEVKASDVANAAAPAVSVSETETLHRTKRQIVSSEEFFDEKENDLIWNDEFEYFGDYFADEDDTVYYDSSHGRGDDIPKSWLRKGEEADIPKSWLRNGEEADIPKSWLRDDESVVVPAGRRAGRARGRGAQRGRSSRRGRGRSSAKGPKGRFYGPGYGYGGGYGGYGGGAPYGGGLVGGILGGLLG